LVKAQSKEIFGKDTIYFDVKTTLRSASGIGSIPDAYVINLAEPFEWYVIENELATHPVYDHIVKQLTKFINGIDNQNSRTQILELLYEEINRDNTLRDIVLSKTKSIDVYRFLSKLLSSTPKIVVIIDEKTEDVEEACQALKYTPNIVEFRTFVDETNPNSYAHLFEPLDSDDNTSIEKVLESQDIEGFIARRKPQKDFEEVFRKFVQEIERLSTNISRKIIETRVIYKTEKPFVCIELRKTQILLHLTLPNTPREKDVKYLRKVYGNKWHGHLVVRNPSEAKSAMEISKKAYEESLH
jgi:predicted transport protein